ncbi:MAG: hypothetical protein A2270_09605 [Elusimicrobia bacterium RIFOXYA12_FULL_51_18]|nr:MAG: hypothetical protein A2270_09605 [Elusimicrobia bacterium RIFOXYA12_FULL_51_18]OGS32757.1 MAG: hypothetical protein A2218_11920 [Elusimicrobia bacterium RIFOXYA2_FULL_53_38]
MAAKIKKYVFLRDDDVTRTDARFLKTFNFLLQAKVPAVYAVIPARIEPGFAASMKNRAGAGKLFEFVQHGLSHRDHSGNRFTKQEFGPSRSLKLQRDDMRKGALLMKKNFGRGAVPAFVPPFHIYNTDTIKAAREAGLKIFTASKMIAGFEKSGVVFLPAKVNINDYDMNLKPRPLDLAGLKRKTMAALRGHGPALGAYFHHSTLDKHNFRVFQDYVGFLKGLEELRWVKLSLISSLKNI